MVSAGYVDEQLRVIGAESFIWGRSERRELRKILIEGETVTHCLNGRYEGGFATLCATDRRLLLIDKKPLYLTLEDVRYDMISEVDYSSRLVDATVRICTVNKQVRFTSFNNDKLRSLTAYLQDQIMAIRQQGVQPVVLPQPIQQPPKADDVTGVVQLQYQVTNPFTKVPLMMKRRVSRFYS